jgi:hemerythrin
MSEMAFFNWNESYSVHVAEIDGQHKHLLGMLNALHEIMGRGGDPQEVIKLAEDLLEYTEYHFAAEEKLMAQAGYPGLAEHREKHRAMTGETRRLLGAAHKGGATVSMQLMHFLKGWLAKHIGETDRDYMPDMQRAGIGY